MVNTFDGYKFFQARETNGIIFTFLEGKSLTVTQKDEPETKFMKEHRESIIERCKGMTLEEFDFYWEHGYQWMQQIMTQVVEKDYDDSSWRTIVLVKTKRDLPKEEFARFLNIERCDCSYDCCACLSRSVRSVRKIMTDHYTAERLYKVVVQNYRNI